MRLNFKLPLCVIFLLVCGVRAAPGESSAPADATESSAPKLALKAGDLWVMAGDSITAQRLHTNYIEAFYRTRYPKLDLRFRNSGIGGNRTGNVLARFDYDVAAWKPAIVSVELGMNDVNNGEDPAKYIAGMRELVERIRAIHAEPALISSSPVNDGSLPGKFRSDRNRRLDAYTDALKKLADEEKVVFVDQYHPLLKLWGENNPEDDAGKAEPGKLAPVKSTGKIPLAGNAVHVGAVGQYTMAATILAGLGVDREVSSATLKAGGSVVEARKCAISDVAARDGRLSFTRLDADGPWPIDPKAKAALELMPAIADLSHYMLTVQGLAPGRYAVSIDGKPAATVTAETLSAGWNMSVVCDGALADRSEKILGLIARLEGKLNTDWRSASKAKNADKLAAAQSAIDACERELQSACEPAPMHFEIQPAP